MELLSNHFVIPASCLDLESSVPRRVQENLLRIFFDHRNGLSENQLKEYYKEKFHYELDVLNYNYHTFKGFVAALPNIFRRVTNQNNYSKLFCAQHKENQIEKRFRQSGDLLKITPLSAQQNIKELLAEFEDGIPFHSFKDVYEARYDAFLDPLDYGLADVKELLNQFNRKLFIIITKDNIKTIQALPKQPNEDENETNISCDLMLLQEHFPTDAYPPGVVTANMPLNPINLKEELPVGKKGVRIVVSHMHRNTATDIRIYFHLYKNLLSLRDLDDRMNQVYVHNADEELVVPELVAVSGFFCAAQFKDHGYNRVQIVRRLPSGARKVYYVDYGGFCDIKRENLRYLKTDFAEKPTQAIIGQIEHSQNYVWSPNAYCFFKNYLFFGNEDTIKADILNYDDEVGMFTVKMSVNGADVIEFMRKKGFIHYNTPIQSAVTSTKLFGDEDEKNKNILEFSNDSYVPSPVNNTPTHVSSSCSDDTPRIDRIEAMESYAPQPFQMNSIESKSNSLQVTPAANSVASPNHTLSNLSSQESSPAHSESNSFGTYSLDWQHGASLSTKPFGLSQSPDVPVSHGSLNTFQQLNATVPGEPIGHNIIPQSFGSSVPLTNPLESALPGFQLLTNPAAMYHNTFMPTVYNNLLPMGFPPIATSHPPGFEPVIPSCIFPNQFVPPILAPGAPPPGFETVPKKIPSSMVQVPPPVHSHLEVIPYQETLYPVWSLNDGNRASAVSVWHASTETVPHFDEGAISLKPKIYAPSFNNESGLTQLFDSKPSKLPVNADFVQENNSSHKQPQNHPDYSNELNELCHETLLEETNNEAQKLSQNYNVYSDGDLGSIDEYYHKDKTSKCLSTFHGDEKCIEAGRTGIETNDIFIGDKSASLEGTMAMSWSGCSDTSDLSAEFYDNYCVDEDVRNAKNTTGNQILPRYCLLYKKVAYAMHEHLYWAPPLEKSPDIKFRDTEVWQPLSEVKDYYQCVDDLIEPYKAMCDLSCVKRKPLSRSIKRITSEGEFKLRRPNLGRDFKSTDQAITVLCIAGKKLHQVLFNDQAYFAVEEIMKLQNELMEGSKAPKACYHVPLEPVEERMVHLSFLPNAIADQLVKAEIAKGPNENVCFIKAHELGQFLYNSGECSRYVLKRVSIALWKLH